MERLNETLRRVKYREHRRVLASLVLDYFRISYVYRKDRKWGTNVDEILVVYSVLQATMEGRYIGPYKIAQATEVPINTVRRRLAALLECGAVTRNSRGYMVTLDVMNSHTTNKALRDLIRIVTDAAAAFSKMEPITIDDAPDAA